MMITISSSDGLVTVEWDVCSEDEQDMLEEMEKLGLVVLGVLDETGMVRYAERLKHDRLLADP